MDKGCWEAEFQRQFPHRNLALKAIQWALSEGIVKGYQDGTFRPNQPVNRSEMAVLITRYLGLSLPEAETEFLDQQAIPAWAEKEIARHRGWHREWALR